MFMKKKRRKMKKSEEVDVVKVEKIVIKIGDKEEEYTLEEAKKLQKLLNDLLGNKESIYIPVPYSVPVPQPYIPYPYTVPYTVPNTSPYWTITWGTSGTSTNTPTVFCNIT
jgi:hypothetical protein